MTVKNEIEFDYSQAQFNVLELKAMGHKSSLIQQELQHKLVGGKQPKSAETAVGKA
jgi:hypothetical protein